ncbi:MAG: hypothetical protein J1E01_08290 [Acetatifactor sp.]|nr:hypothetical protein [Acetatifactor sp.]
MGKKKVPVLLMVLVLTLIMLCACGGTPAASSGDSKSSESKQENSGETEEKVQKEKEEIPSDEETSKTVSFYDGQRVVYVLYHRWDGDYDDNDVDMVMMYSPEPDGTYTEIFIGDSSFLKGLFSLEGGLPSNDEMFAIANKYIEEWTDLPDHTIYEREGTDNDHPYFRKQIQGYENSSFCWQIQENCEIDPGVVAPMESKILERIELGGKEYFVVEKGRWLMEITDDIKDVEYFPHVTELR